VLLISAPPLMLKMPVFCFALTFGWRRFSAAAAAQRPSQLIKEGFDAQGAPVRIYSFFIFHGCALTPSRQVRVLAPRNEMSAAPMPNGTSKSKLPLSAFFAAAAAQRKPAPHPAPSIQID
jgi:hypothetical protein